MPKNPPESVQHHLRHRLNTHAKERWPQLSGIQVRFRAGFAYVAGELPGKQEPLPLCRLRFTGVPHTWGFARYLASSGTYEENILPTGLPFGSPEEALDCAGGRYLDSPRTVTDAPAPVGIGLVRIPVGLVLLVGAPASGKTSFVRALIARRQIDAETVVSSDEIRAELFGYPPAEADPDAVDARIFEERDRRIIARLAAGRSAVAESTNVTPQARARLLAIARRFNAPVTMLRFTQDVTDLLQQHIERGRPDVTAADVRTYAAIMMRDAGADQVLQKPGRQVDVLPATGLRGGQEVGPPRGAERLRGFHRPVQVRDALRVAAGELLTAQRGVRQHRVNLAAQHPHHGVMLGALPVGARGPSGVPRTHGQGRPPSRSRSSPVSVVGTRLALLLASPLVFTSQRPFGGGDLHIVRTSVMRVVQGAASMGIRRFHPREDLVLWASLNWPQARTWQCCGRCAGCRRRISRAKQRSRSRC
ncbi:AAA family ATPase [Streptomyces sp. NPDC050485]|uniref:AAA family ATPase n=1 Tax=Streptomyces sp. NPDC050485 TaxID=3365617 RepID=UPI0037B53A5B